MLAIQTARAKILVLRGQTPIRTLMRNGVWPHETNKIHARFVDFYSLRYS